MLSSKHEILNKFELSKFQIAMRDGLWAMEDEEQMANSDWLPETRHWGAKGEAKRAGLWRIPLSLQESLSAVEEAG